MQAPHRYPAGVQVFSDIRERNMLYVDKTHHIWEMLNAGSSFWFLSRPRRFGKTLLVSTMEAYFQGRRELFDGLFIGEHEREWRVSPVLRFDLSSVKATTEEGLREALDYVLNPYEGLYGTSGRSESYSSRVGSLIRRAHELTGEKVVVLVDEYDSPLLTVVDNPSVLQRFREVMREFFSPLKASEPMLRFVFLTGISKFSQLSIFSELNNLNNISMDTSFSDICGITADELAQGMVTDIEFLAERLGVTAEQAMSELRERYDGYHFARVSPDVYNPYSLMLAFQKGELGNYWFGSGTPTSLTRVLRRFDFDVTTLEGLRARSTSFDAPTEQMDSPVPLLYQSGYLTIKDYDRMRDMYTLGIPNAEVSQGLYETLVPAYTGASAIERDSFLDKVIGALLAGDLDAALHQLRTFLAGVPYDLAAKGEKEFQSQLFLVLKLMGISVRSEVRTATGRIDAIIETDDTLYVLELKYGGSAQAALEQIDSRGYLIPYETTGKRLVKAGVNFNPEERTIEEGWLVQEG